MKYLLLLALPLLLGCIPKRDISFEVTYPLNGGEVNLATGYLTIKYIDLNFQAKAEQNYTKKSLIKEINLNKISSNIPFEVKELEYLHQGKWMHLKMDSLEINKNKKSYYLHHSSDDFLPIFQTGKLSVRVKLPKEDSHFKLTSISFIMKGKLEKTNILYRIIG